jgi:hypothetical protein
MPKLVAETYAGHRQLHHSDLGLQLAGRLIDTGNDMDLQIASKINSFNPIFSESGNIAKSGHLLVHICPVFSVFQ